jgi:hypothetical protein
MMDPIILTIPGVPVPRRRPFTEADREYLLAVYNDYAGKGRLAELAEMMGRTAQFLCRHARALGLTSYHRKRADAHLFSARISQAIAEHGHARGMAGKSHSPETKQRLSETTASRWNAMSSDEQSAFILKGLKTKRTRYGSIAPPKPRGSWKAGWREIGSCRKYYRSRWEANYARYLQWLFNKGEILDWEHEPETFWFDAIKRGVRSYLPDFRVWENDGTSKLHEVKGWMDARSHTTLKRMAKYHPGEAIVLIKEKDYRAIERSVSRLIEGWE